MGTHPLQFLSSYLMQGLALVRKCMAIDSCQCVLQFERSVSAVLTAHVRFIAVLNCNCVNISRWLRWLG